MDEHEIRERPRFEPRVITPPDMPPFESTVARQLDVLNQSDDSQWNIILRTNNGVVQLTRKIEPMLRGYMSLQIWISLIPTVAAIVAIIIALKK